MPIGDYIFSINEGYEIGDQCRDAIIDMTLIKE